MTICQCKSEPNRNDEFAKNGYSALCPTHKHQEGTKQSYVKLEGGKDEPKKESITE